MKKKSSERRDLSMVEATTAELQQMEIPALQEFIQGEVEALENIYFEDEVIGEAPSVTQVPKHVLVAKLEEEMKKSGDHENGDAN